MVFLLQRIYNALRRGIKQFLIRRRRAAIYRKAEEVLRYPKMFSTYHKGAHTGAPLHAVLSIKEALLIISYT